MRRKSDIWNARRRAIQSMRCRYAKPWTNSTGPRTDSGKAISSQNAWVRGARSRYMARICAVLAQQRRYMQTLRQAQKKPPRPLFNPGFSAKVSALTSVQGNTHVATTCTYPSFRSFTDDH